MKIKPAAKRGEVLLKLKRTDDALLERGFQAAVENVSPFRLKEILVPIDFSEPSRKALDYAIPFAEKFGARITLVHVVEPRIYPEAAVVPSEMEESNIAMMKDARKQLETMRKARIPRSIASQVHVHLGTPHAQIVATALASEADLIIIATRGLSGLKHFLLGSTAERVVRHAPCPVLTVRQKENDFVPTNNT